MAEVRLEPLRAEHAADTYRWLCDPAVADNLGLRRAPSLERTLDWIGRLPTDPGVRGFAIVCDRRHVGNVVLDQIDHQVGACRLFIFVGDATARGHGVGRAAVRLAAEVAFGPLGLNKVWLTVHCHNTAAVRAYLSAGFTIEGVLRDEFWMRGRRLNAFRMGLLAADFRPLTADAA